MIAKVCFVKFIIEIEKKINGIGIWLKLKYLVNAIFLSVNYCLKLMLYYVFDIQMTLFFKTF